MTAFCAKFWIGRGFGLLSHDAIDRDEMIEGFQQPMNSISPNLLLLKKRNTASISKIVSIPVSVSKMKNLTVAPFFY